MRFDSDPPPAARIELDTAPLGGGGWPSPSSPPRVARRYEEPVAIAPRRRRGSRFVWVLLVLLLAGGAAAVFAAPRYLAYRVGEAAHRSGFRVTFDDATFRPDAITLLGVRAAPIDLAVADIANVGEVAINLNRGRPSGVSVRGFDVKVHGEIGSVVPVLQAWVRNYPSLLSLRAESGHVLWSAPLGEGTELESWDLAIRGGAERSASCPSLVLRGPGGSLGPWKVGYSETSGARTIEVTPMPSSDHPAVVWTRQDDGRGEATFDLAASPASAAGLPAALLALGGDPTVAIRSSCSWTASGKVDGKVHVELGSVRAGDSPAAPVDIALDGELAAGSWSPLALERASVAAGNVKGKAAGSIAIGPGAVRVELAMKWPLKTAGLPASLVLDTRDLSRK